MSAQLTKSQQTIADARPKIKEQHERILEHGPELQNDILEFYLDVLDFKTTRIENVPKYRIAGYATWEDLQRKICELMKQSRSSFYQHIRLVESLPPATIKKLGKSKGFMAARLTRKGKLPPEVEDKLDKANVEGAKSITRKIMNKTPGENRIKFTLMLRESQWNLLDAQMDRVREMAGEEGLETALDQLLAWLTQQPDHTLAAICRGQDTV